MKKTGLSAFRNNRIKIWLLLCGFLLLIHCTAPTKKSTVYIIGDSTVKNGSGEGANGLWGWGDFIAQSMDTARVTVQNHALGGTSSRTFQTKGLWVPILEKLQPGDCILMQFGHNDGGNINDNHRARGTIKGIGDASEEIDNILTKKHEIVHSYGWYMRTFIKDAKSKGAVPIIISPIPRNRWKDGKIIRNTKDSYGLWSKQVAEIENIQFLNLNEMMATALEKVGEENCVGTYFFEHDATHTTKKGAELAASFVIEGLRTSELDEYLIIEP